MSSLIEYIRRRERGEAPAPDAPPQTPLERALAELAEERTAHDLAGAMLRERGDEIAAQRARIFELETLVETATAPAARKRG